jgi:hypothetical protein
MVSYYRDPSGEISLRDVSSSGRPKPILVKEDADYLYTYTRSGSLNQKVPKTDERKYYDFLSKEVIYQNQTTGKKGTIVQGIQNNVADKVVRITPPSAWENEVGYGALSLVDIAREGIDVGYQTLWSNRHPTWYFAKITY